MSVTPLMGLNIPDVLSTSGPVYATLMNAAMNLVDAHDHSPGKGALITPSGMSINADLDFNSQNAIGLSATQYEAQGASLSGAANALKLYFVGAELFCTDGNGNAVQLTSGGSINVASVGTIGGDYASTSASVLYSNTLGAKSYSFLQGTPDTTRSANVNVGKVSIYDNSVTGGAYTRLIASPGLVASFDMTLLSALPASTLPLIISSSGQLSSAQITTAQIADSNVTTAKILDANVTTSKIADDNVTTAKLPNGAVTMPKLAGPNWTISSSCGNFLFNSTSFVAVTNLSASLTTNGRPLKIYLVSDGSGNNSAIWRLGGANNLARINIRFKRGSTVIANFIAGVSDVSVAPPTAYIPPGSFIAVDTPASGTYTYSVEAATENGTVNCFVDYCKLVVEELNA